MTMTTTQAARPDRRLRRGLSIVELMVGVTIGLFILAGATMVLTTQLGDNRRLLLEAQVQQDLRSTVDLISREIRAAGYWGNAYTQVWKATATNPYSASPLVATANSTSLEYYKSLEANTDNNSIDPNEYGGFRLNASTHTIEVQLGSDNWQQLTDPAVLTVTQFTLVPNTVAVDIPPSVPGAASTLKLCSRDVTLTIIVRAVHDAAVQRSISNRIRLRNDVVKASCT